MHVLTPSSSCDCSAQKYIQVLLSWNSLALLMSAMVDHCYSAASVMLWIYLSWDILLASWWLVFNCTIILEFLNYLCTWHAHTISAELLQWLSSCFTCPVLVWCHHSSSYPNTESLPDYTRRVTIELPNSHFMLDLTGEFLYIMIGTYFLHAKNDKISNFISLFQIWAKQFSWIIV